MHSLRGKQSGLYSATAPASLQVSTFRRFIAKQCAKKVNTFSCKVKRDSLCADKYWILFGGRGMAVSEGQFYEISVGNCLATRMGNHHDYPQVFETMRGVYFETTRKGQKRLGHLWNHTHGPAQPLKKLKICDIEKIGVKNNA